MRRLLLLSIRFMVRCTDISKINIVFNSLCYVFSSKSVNADVEFHILKLESFIRDDDDPTCSENYDFSEP